MTLFDELFPDVRSEDEAAAFSARVVANTWNAQRAYHKRERAKDPERYRAKYTAWAKANPEKNKKRKQAYFLNRNYGITPEQKSAMLEAQGGRCGNLRCGATEPGGKGDWHVDHDHATDEIRSLLCHRCNTMLGLGRDDPEVLRGGAEYLERFR